MKSSKPMYLQRMELVEYVKQHPGCSTDAVSEVIGLSRAATRHRLLYIAERNYIFMDREESGAVAGGTRAIWYYLRDFEVPAAVRRREELKMLVKKSAGRGSPYRGVAIPDIFLMHQPPMPITPKGAKVRSNTKDGRKPIKNPDAMGSGRRDSWVNSNAPLSTLAL